MYVPSWNNAMVHVDARSAGILFNASESEQFLSYEFEYFWLLINTENYFHTYEFALRKCMKKHV